MRGWRCHHLRPGSPDPRRKAVSAGTMLLPEQVKHSEPLRVSQTQLPDPTVQAGPRSSGPVTLTPSAPMTFLLQATLPSGPLETITTQSRLHSTWKANKMEPVPGSPMLSLSAERSGNVSFQTVRGHLEKSLFLESGLQDLGGSTA